MQLDVPFSPDPDYLRFLIRRADAVESVHVGLQAPGIPDARYRLENRSMADLIESLRRIRGPRRLALLNSRFHPPGAYTDPEALKAVLHRLDALVDASAIDGIVFADPYHLTALSDAGPETAARLEAVPSVNFMIDTAGKAEAVMEIIARTRFRMPRRLVLDRGLNRSPDALSETATRLRADHPGLRIGLLANEGCLHRCPFKPAHDALIALTHLGRGMDTFELNRRLGCIRYLTESPEAIFRSPFIRPEDLGQYRGIIDFVKVCGRTLGPAFSSRVVRAYLDGAYPGNLLDLLDAPHWMADRYYIDNPALPADFFDQLTGCDGRCDDCRFCERLFARVARPLADRLGDLLPGHPST